MFTFNITFSVEYQIALKNSRFATYVDTISAEELKTFLQIAPETCIYMVRPIWKHLLSATAGSTDFYGFD